MQNMIIIKTSVREINIQMVLFDWNQEMLVTLSRRSDFAAPLRPRAWLACSVNPPWWKYNRFRVIWGKERDFKRLLEKLLVTASQEAPSRKANKELTICGLSPSLCADA